MQSKEQSPVQSKEQSTRELTKRAILFAGVSSGSGKTTVTTGILSALKARGIDLSAFKCGPDYIDPMFHRHVLGLPSFNLDPYFLEGESLRNLFVRRAREFSVIEGVMGYYDGVGTAGDYSTYSVASRIGVPVVLVVNAEGMATSVGAVIRGFRDFRKDSGVCGVIFNCVSPMMYPFLKKVAEDAGVRAYGFLPKDESVAFESRQLGLNTDIDSDVLQQRLSKLKELTERFIDLDALLSIGGEILPSEADSESECRSDCGVDFKADCGTEIERELPIPQCEAENGRRPTIAVAKDKAFCFLYEENLECLRKYGANIVFFSPMEDDALPDADGIYLPGGVPERYLKDLSANGSMLRSVKEAVGRGTPTVAECGGFLYLHREIDGIPMAGVLEGSAYRTEKLQRFGYIEMTAKRDNVLCKTGERIRSHEFHYYESSEPGDGFSVARARGGEAYSAAVLSDRLYAGFPHLYFGANEAFAENFVKAAAAYSNFVRIQK